MRVVSRLPSDEHLAYIRDELATLDAADATAIIHPDLGDTPSSPFAIVLTPTICITITHHHLTADRVGVLHIAATGPWTLQGSDEQLVTAADNPTPQAQAHQDLVGRHLPPELLHRGLLLVTVSPAPNSLIPVTDQPSLCGLRSVGRLTDTTDVDIATEASKLGVIRALLRTAAHQTPLAMPALADTLAQLGALADTAASDTEPAPAPVATLTAPTALPAAAVTTPAPATPSAPTKPVRRTEPAPARATPPSAPEPATSRAPGARPRRRAAVIAAATVTAAATLAGLVYLLGPPARQQFASSDFSSPSGNIRCRLTEDPAAPTAACTITEVASTYPAPPPPAADCTDYGRTLIVTKGHGAPHCTRAPVASSATVPTALQYGASVTLAGVRCDSSALGITCQRTDNPGGFRISRESYTTW